MKSDKLLNSKQTHFRYSVRIDTYQGNFFVIDTIADNPHDAGREALKCVAECGAGYNEKQLKVGYVFDQPNRRNIKL